MNMKKQLIFAAAFLLVGLVSQAQHIRLNGYTSYVFDDKVDGYYDANNNYAGTIKGGFLWGAGIEFSPRPFYGIELSYLRQDSHLPDFTYYDGGRKRTTNLKFANNWIMIGGLRYFPTHSERVEPYVGGQLGIALINTDNPLNGVSNSYTKFAWGFKGGANIWLTDKVALKLQAQLLSAVQALGGGFYLGTGGAGVGVSSYSSLLQFNLGGGLSFKLGNAMAPKTTTTK
jgi:opacity protein-like surface antigen